MLFDRVIKFLTSLRLTVVLLGLGLVLVFAGTLAQVQMGLYKAQNEFFRSFFVYWQPSSGSFKIPVLPGGYLIGGLLLLNLVASHFTRFTLSRKKIGIWMIHAGLILLLLGQLLTDMLARESGLHLREDGPAKNYSEADRQDELAVIDTTDADMDTVVAIPQGLLSEGKEIHNSQLPFAVRIKSFYPNSQVEERTPDANAPTLATQGFGPRVTLKPLARVTDTNMRDEPAAVLELVDGNRSLGSWVVSDGLKPQTFSYNNHNYQLLLRPRRYYKPFSLKLVKFQHDIYQGTDIPKNFSSRVLLQRADTGERREVLIYMNNPLRYDGETFYQADWDHDDDKGTILQVVHNPGWLTPYFSCILVGLGLVIHFAMNLFGFAFSRRAT